MYDIHGVYLVDFKRGIGGELSGKHYSIIISKIVSYSFNDRLNDVLNEGLNDVLNESEHELLTIIAVAPSVTQDWYCEKTGFSIAKVQRIMKKLQEKGIIYRYKPKIHRIETKKYIMIRNDIKTVIDK